MNNIVALSSKKIQSIFWQSACGFSKFSHRQTTPKILRDHRFTRNGMVMGKQPKSVTVQPADIPASQAHLEHLFSNKAEDLKLLRKQAEQKEKNIMNKHIFEDHSVPDTLILEMSDAFLIANHPEKVLNNILELEKKFINSSSPASNASDLRDLATHALNQIISSKILALSLRDFGVLVTLSRRFLNNDARVWESLANNFCRLLQNQEYHSQVLLSSERSQKQLDNIIFTLTSVLKNAKRFQLTSALESLTDAVSSFLTKNTHLIENMNHRVLLLANVLPLVSMQAQIELITSIRAAETLSAISTLQTSTLTALAHSLYKVRQSNAANSKFQAANLLDAALLQKIEQAWIKSFDGKNEDLLSIFAYSMASLNHSGETKGLVVKYVEKNAATISQNLNNLAFLGEALKKFHALNPKFFATADLALKDAVVAPELALQFLRIFSPKFSLKPETSKALIEQLNQAFYFRKYNPKQSHQDMIVKTLNHYSAVVELDTLPIYITLSGSKKIF